MTMMESIVAVAIRRDGLIYSIERPARHHHVMAAVDLAHGAHHDVFLPDEQGFLTSAGRYVGRFEARDIARNAKQLLDRAAKLPELYSEDVW